MIKSIKHYVLKLADKEADFPMRDELYSKINGQKYDNRFTGYVCVTDYGQYPVYEFERPDKNENYKIHYYFKDNKGYIHFTRKPNTEDTSQIDV